MSNISPLSNVSALAAATALLLGMGMATPAHAIFRISLQNPSGVCQGALPVFDTALRNRPAAIVNEGTSAAFVSCSMQGDNTGSDPPATVGAVFFNNTGAAATVNCTFVDGTRAIALAFFPKSVPVPANSQAQLAWTPAVDNGGNPFSQINNLSCSLPPGVEISVVVRHVDDNAAIAP